MYTGKHTRVGDGTSQVVDDCSSVIEVECTRVVYGARVGESARVGDGTS